jgi:hypothetical protein
MHRDTGCEVRPELARYEWAGEGVARALGDLLSRQLSKLLCQRVQGVASSNMWTSVLNGKMTTNREDSLGPVGRAVYDSKVLAVSLPVWVQAD